MNNSVSVSTPLTASAITIDSVPLDAENFDNSNLDFSQMFVFGDSLSDTGNFFSLIGGQPPNSEYFDGRISNGPIWIDSLASSLELDLNPTAFFTGTVSPDGGNYAITGARSGNDNVFDTLPGLEQQLQRFIGPLLETNQSANSDALYTLWVGGNDYLSGASPNPDITVNNITDSIEDLYDVGARNFLIPNLLSLGLLPQATLEGRVLT